MLFRSVSAVADFGAQAIVCKLIKDAFPSDPIVGEEDADDLRTPEMAARLTQVTSYEKTVLPDATDRKSTRLNSSH